jgi:hypothetical protein
VGSSVAVDTLSTLGDPDDEANEEKPDRDEDLGEEGLREGVVGCRVGTGQDTVHALLDDEDESGKDDDADGLEDVAGEEDEGGGLGVSCVKVDMGRRRERAGDSTRQRRGTGWESGNAPQGKADRKSGSTGAKERERGLDQVEVGQDTPTG